MDESIICITVLHCQANSYGTLRRNCPRKALATVGKVSTSSAGNLTFAPLACCFNPHCLYSFVIKAFSLTIVIFLFGLISVFYVIPHFIDHFCSFSQDTP
jgi:hypothetical protein